MKWTRLPLLFVLLVPACESTREESQPVEPFVVPDGPPPDPHPGLHEFPWTDAFLESALLVADEVTIEGPQGLLQHSVCRQDNAVHTRTERALPDGYVQEIVINSPTSPEIRCQLDALQIAATRRIRVIETIGRKTVVVRATGDAFWKESITGAEQRGPEIELTGEVTE